MPMFSVATSKKKPVTILLTCCLGDYMKGTIRCFKNNPDRRKIRIVGTDMNEMTYNFVGVDAFYKVSRCNDENYVMELVKICSKEKVDVLIPCNTLELERLSRAKDAFELIGTKVLVSGIEGLQIANDKIKAHEYFERSNIPTTLTLITSNYDELRAFLDSHRDKTFVMKQRKGCGSRGFRIIGQDEGLLTDKPNGVFIDDEELMRVFCGKEEYIVQEYLPGNEFTVDAVVDNGKVLYQVCKKNEDMENGVARKSTVCFDFDCLLQCKMVCDKLKLHGNIGFDLKCDSDGFPIIIDVNPRLTATVSLAEKAGVNLPYLALLLALNEPVYDGYKLKEGTSLIRRIEDYYFDERGDRIG